MGAACASALIVTIPAIETAHETQREEAQTRLEITAFAAHQDGGTAARALADASNILEHPWLVRMEGNLENRSMAMLSNASAFDRDNLALATVAEFETRHTDTADTVATEFQCMAEAVYYEARSESLSGQLAVAEVVSNRVTDHRYPNSICGVVYQGSTRTTGCQFTFTCDGSLSKDPRGDRWEQAQQVAAQVMMGLNEPRTRKATHYHADYVDPVWNSGLVHTQTIGTHIFYRFPRGTEWASARERLSRRMAAREQGIQTVSAAVEPQAPSVLVAAVATTPVAAYTASQTAAIQSVPATGPAPVTVSAAPTPGGATADLNAMSLQTVSSAAP